MNLWLLDTYLQSWWPKLWTKLQTCYNIKFGYHFNKVLLSLKPLKCFSLLIRWPYCVFALAFYNILKLSDHFYRAPRLFSFSCFFFKLFIFVFLSFFTESSKSFLFPVWIWSVFHSFTHFQTLNLLININ